MQRAEFLRQVSTAIGMPIRRHNLEYALRIGVVSEPKRFPRARREYTEKHKQQFVKYLQARIDQANSSSTNQEGA